jgi:ubiquinone/menaquinone biosynthesis C-methylase UbiE
MDEIINYYNDLAGSYDENRFDNTYGKFIDLQERAILDKIINPEEHSVDLACGTGRLSNYAQIGIDASAAMVEIAKKKFPEKVFLKNEADALDLDNDSVDMILSFHFFMHLDENKTKKILEECNRVLKKNGRIILDIPSRKRRKIFDYKANNWHGANSLSISDFTEYPNFKVKRTFGILFFPIHRFPNFCRRFFVKIDSVLANSFLKEYSSYLIIELEKK